MKLNSTLYGYFQPQMQISCHVISHFQYSYIRCHMQFTRCLINGKIFIEME